MYNNPLKCLTHIHHKKQLKIRARNRFRNAVGRRVMQNGILFDNLKGAAFPE